VESGHWKRYFNGDTSKGLKEIFHFNGYFKRTERDKILYFNGTERDISMGILQKHYTSTVVSARSEIIPPSSACSASFLQADRWGSYFLRAIDWQKSWENPQQRMKKIELAHPVYLREGVNPVFFEQQSRNHSRLLLSGLVSPFPLLSGLVSPFPYMLVC
jgi:hypothetical protein